jgi:hypothetical protein
MRRRRDRGWRCTSREGRRARVESIVGDSRNLARLMFVESTTVASVRNLASRFMSLEMAMGSIVKAFEEPI